MEKGQDLCPDEVSLEMHVASGDLRLFCTATAPASVVARDTGGEGGGECQGKYIATENKIAHFQYFACYMVTKLHTR